ncbi:MAG: DoxX family protein [Deltaproteobacteria bacterium]|nr:DoxX family protein [Deltaproteobacteria bacterium]
MHISKDLSEFLFRLLFCTIFIGLGAEHLFSDTLLRELMPLWVPFPRGISILCGVWLVGWGSLIFLGWHLRWAATALAAFLVVVTLVVHAPGILSRPDGVAQNCAVFWDILQRSNLVKNICLLGVCFHLLHHEPGRYSLQSYLAKGSPAS